MDRTNGAPVRLRNLDRAELEALLGAWGQPAYRAGQILRWLARGAVSPDEMTDLPAALRKLLFERAAFGAPAMVRRQISKDGTRKYLWELWDGNCVETVLMRYLHGYSVCISSQAGCRMGCVFCASTKNGLVRNLEPGEMAEQVLFTGLDAGVRISNIVLMGTGEPLDNFDNTVRFIRLASSPEGLNIGARHISLSTSGLCDKIDRLAELSLQITLSVSLHAPTDELRRQIMPVARTWPLSALMDSCRRYYDRTGRRISFEYAMIRGFNDTPACARRLAGLVRGMGAHVNLIPLNHIEESPLAPSRPEDVRRFQELLAEKGVNVTVRRRLGSDIDASCGQLRRKYLGGQAQDGSCGQLRQKDLSGQTQDGDRAQIEAGPKRPAARFVMRPRPVDGMGEMQPGGKA